ncbi:MAG: hypothetical protein GAK38_03523 [Xylophilus sp.]|nr:MAG: hypothetical protein GAK38_03523 [Xylophilus sp.]
MRHPRITVELLTTDRNLSLARHEVDVALRLARPAEGDLVIRRVATMANAFYATTAQGTADRLERERQFVAFGRDSTVPEAVWMREHVEGPVAFRSNSLVGQKSAALAGLGIALLPCYLGDREPGLRRLALDRPPPAREIWLVVNRTHARVPHIRAVAQALAEAFERCQLLFAGGLPIAGALIPEIAQTPAAQMRCC